MSAYWLSAFLWDLLLYMIPFVLALILLVAFNQTAYLGSHFGATFLIFFLYGPAVISFTYLTSFFYKKHTTALYITIFVLLASGVLLVCFTVLLLLFLYSSS